MPKSVSYESPFIDTPITRTEDVEGVTSIIDRHPHGVKINFAIGTSILIPWGRVWNVTYSE